MKSIKNYIMKRLFKERTGFTKIIENKKKNHLDDDIDDLIEEYEEEKNEIYNKDC